MAQKRVKRPRDPIQLGKLIVDIATGQVEDGRDSHAVEQGVRSGDTQFETDTSGAA
jgi:hypothetical protein